MQPVYLESYKNGKLQAAAEQALKLLERCSICPRICGVDRLKGEQGFCKAGRNPLVYSYMAHQGEEPPLSGSRGSGTIFFSFCNMSCVYCQNYEFSQSGKGKEASADDLAAIMLELQAESCHNINLVTPTHLMPQILEALCIAVPQGLRIPLVYNTGGYERPEMICLLEGIVDIYLVDMRYGDVQAARVFSNAPDYPEYNRRAVRQMHEQVGIASFDANDIMQRGVIIRHLVLPNDFSGTDAVMKFIAAELSPETYISLMSQYRPYDRALSLPELNRRLTGKEYEEAQAIMERHGLHNGWVQESFGLERLAGVHIKPKARAKDSE